MTRACYKPGSLDMTDKRTITVTVNGARTPRRRRSASRLADFIRYELGLTGTHLGCEHGVCGACTILLDGQSARSCLMLAVQADGHDVLPSRASPRPRQAASVAGGVPRQPRPAMRLLHARAC